MEVIQTDNERVVEMVNKDQSIIMQVCAKIASELTPKSESVDANIVAFSTAYEAVCDIILTSQGLTSTEATPAVTTSATPLNEESMIRQSFPQATETAPSDGFTVRIKGKQHGPIPQWLVDECAKKGVTEVWDNRDGLAANPKRPWFKSTSSNDAFWEPKRK